MKRTQAKMNQVSVLFDQMLLKIIIVLTVTKDLLYCGNIFFFYLLFKGIVRSFQKKFFHDCNLSGIKLFTSALPFHEKNE